MLVLIYIVEVHFNLISLLSLLTEKAAPVINSIDDVCRQCFLYLGALQVLSCESHMKICKRTTVRQKKNLIKLS